MNCVLLSENLSAEILIYGTAGDCLNLGKSVGKKMTEHEFVMLKT